MCILKLGTSTPSAGPTSNCHATRTVGKIHTNILPVIAGVLVLPAFVRDFALPPSGTTAYNNIVENVVSMLQLGGLIGSIATIPLMKFSGSKIAMAVAGAVYFLGAALQVCFLQTPCRSALMTVPDVLQW